MIQSTLIEAKYRYLSVAIVPFPIHHPERWSYYCPMETDTICAYFFFLGARKATTLSRHDWHVEVLDEGVAKEVSGSEVRQRLREGREWDVLVSR